MSAVVLCRVLFRRGVMPQSVRLPARERRVSVVDVVEESSGEERSVTAHEELAPETEGSSVFRMQPLVTLPVFMKVTLCESCR